MNVLTCVSLFAAFSLIGAEPRLIGDFTPLGRNSRSPQGFPEGYEDLAVSSARGRIAGASRARAIALWDTKSGTEIDVLVKYPERWSDTLFATAIGYSAEGNLLAALSVAHNGVGQANTAARLRIWNQPAGRETTFQIEREFKTPHLAVAPDGKSVAAWLDQAGEATLWRISDGELGKPATIRPVSRGGKLRIRDLLILPAGNELLLACANERRGKCELVVCGFDPAKPQRRIGSTDHDVQAISLSGDDKILHALVLLAQGGWGTQSWNIETGQEAAAPRPLVGKQPEDLLFGFDLNGANLSPYGARLAVIPAKRRELLVYDLSTGQQTVRIALPEGKKAMSVFLEASGNAIVASLNDYRLLVWDISSPAPAEGSGKSSSP